MDILKDNFTELPNEILFNILSYFNNITLWKGIRGTCKKFDYIVKDIVRNNAKDLLYVTNPIGFTKMDIPFGINYNTTNPYIFNIVANSQNKICDFIYEFKAYKLYSVPDYIKISPNL